MHRADGPGRAAHGRHGTAALRSGLYRAGGDGRDDKTARPGRSERLRAQVALPVARAALTVYRGMEMADLHISVNGQDAVDDSLWDWLRGEPELRGYLRRGEKDAPTGAMGASTELIVAVTSSGAVAALARSLQVWFTQLRSDVDISIRGKGGQEVTVKAKHVQDLKDFTATVFELSGDLPGDAPGDR
jgi:hypothetical protein